MDLRFHPVFYGCFHRSIPDVGGTMLPAARGCLSDADERERHRRGLRHDRRETAL